MTRLNGAGRWMARAMAAVMLFVSMPLGVAQAGMITTDRVVEQAVAQQDRLRILEFLDREDVRRELEALGIEPGEAAARVGSLSDAEVARISGELDQLPAGQSAAGTIVGVFLLVLIILLITDILGLTNVYPFVRSAR